jgi:hypothetical protein
MSAPAENPHRATLVYLGLAIVAMTTVMFEILLTRLFSIALFYHMAFVAISMAMFGITFGAIIVFLRPDVFTESKTERHLVSFSLLFSVSLVVSFLLFAWLSDNPLSGIAAGANLPIIYVCMAIPFVFSGISTCLALTKTGHHIGKLYASDLIGAASGCFLLAPLLEWTDGPSAVVFLTSMASLAALIFAQQTRGARFKFAACGLMVTAALFGVYNTQMAPSLQAPLHFKYPVGGQPFLYEKWNCFSRIRVYGDPSHLHRPWAWGLSDTWPSQHKVSELSLGIDDHADTNLERFDGTKYSVDYLNYDLASLVHHVVHDGRVLVVGVGGGRDVVAGIVFGQKAIEGVELNHAILDAVTNKFAEYTGHLDRYPQVRLINDEARSYIARAKAKYDVIQLSLIDTFAASAAGAFVLTEHSLYTTDAWAMFLDHLSPHGMLSVCRWYSPEHPAETYRLITLATSALHRLGVNDTRDHIAVVVRPYGGTGHLTLDGIGTLLVSPAPFTKQQRDEIANFAKQRKFTILASSWESSDPFAAALAAGDALKLISSYPLDISAPTDDRPFYLFFLRLPDIFNPDRLKVESAMFTNGAVTTLGNLLIIVTLVTLLCFLWPLALAKQRVNLKTSWPLLLFFAAIGLGFMFVEVAQMQRLIIFLGHPVYGLSVVLFVLLLASGLGSLSTAALTAGDASHGRKRLVILLLTLVCIQLLSPLVTKSCAGSDLFTRVLAASALLFPMGVFMGMAFPLGLLAVPSDSEELRPWLWAINGATSVYASVLATAVSLAAGFTATYLTGCACYLVALAAYVRASKRTAVQ